MPFVKTSVSVTKPETFDPTGTKVGERKKETKDGEEVWLVWDGNAWVLEKGQSLTSHTDSE